MLEDEGINAVGSHSPPTAETVGAGATGSEVASQVLLVSNQGETRRLIFQDLLCVDLTLVCKVAYAKKRYTPMVQLDTPLLHHLVNLKL